MERYPRDDDRFLLAFLRARKYDVPRAAELVGNFARFWYSHPDLINGLCAEKCRPFLEMHMMKFLSVRGPRVLRGVGRGKGRGAHDERRPRLHAALVLFTCTPLPTFPSPPQGKDIHGNSLVALYMGALDVARYAPQEQAAFSVYALANLFEDDELQLHGGTYVETMEGFSLGSAMALGRKMDSKEQKEMMALATQTFPMRIRAIYLVHQPWYFSLFWAIVRCVPGARG